MTSIKFHITPTLTLILLLGMLEAFASYSFQQLPADSVSADSVTNQKYEPSYRPTFRQQDRFGDPFSNTQSPSPLLLEDPASMQLDLEIDTGMNYTIYERVGALNYRPRSTMTFEEFNRYQDAEMKKEYWQTRSSGLDGESAVSGRRLIPKLYISPVFDRIFGGSYVDIEPNGLVSLDFGGRWQRIENPAIPINQQRNGGFNYNQQISMNVVGKVGEKLAITANFDNNNSFDYQNNLKVEYTGYEEDIIKKIEIGNVSMGVSNSLMSGGQSLFGIKTQLQFGKLYVTGLASRQQGKTQNKSFQFGAEGQPFTLRAADYDERRHFFLSHFFRDNYEAWLEDIPQVISGVTINRVEVYVVNTSNETANVRNFIGFTDLGELDYDNLENTGTWGGSVGGPSGNSNEPADNDTTNINGLWKYITTNENSIRDNPNVETFLSGKGMTAGTDYEIRPTARRLEDREFKFHPKLGYISLQRKLQNDEVLAVAFEYTYAGKYYRVGELSNSYNGRPDDDLIYLKLLRPGRINTELKTWDLMMKNVYSLNSPRINQEGFELRINYRDDTKNYDAPNLNVGANTNNVPLIELLALDQLNVNGDNQKDGKFDFIPDVTFDVDNGYVIFPVLEPFGTTLESKFNKPSEDGLIETYVFQNLYDKSKIDAQQDIAKNKFFINGTYSSSAAGVYPLNAFNIAKGSVKVTAGSQLLAEGVDYDVNYNTGGTVTILNQGVIASGKQIDISYEVDDLFSFRSRWLTGARLDYRFSDKVNVGATVFHLSERPGGVSRYTAGNEPIKNTKYGFDVNYQEESRMLTKMLDALPLISTKEKSTVTFNGEFAQLLPGTSNKVNGESSSYIDDFENAVTPYNIAGGHLPWKLGSTPDNFKDSRNDSLGANYKRAKMAWYIVDRSAFYLSGGNKPDNITDEDLQNHYVRPILPREIYKQQDRQVVNTNLPIFDIAYYPEERGPYNYNPNLTQDGLLPDPAENFGAITRAISGEVNFRQNNMEYIEFWMMDPFIKGDRGVVQDGIINRNNSTGGQLIFNIGDVSENLLESGKHEFENGLPPDGSLSNTEPTSYGKVTTNQYLTEFFDNSASARPNQDVGLDGINSEEERQLFEQIIGLNNMTSVGQQRIRDDVAADDFEYFLSDNYDQRNAKILERYKKFNGIEGNSPIGAGSNSFTASATNIPENEDLNDDNYVNTQEAYREYVVDMSDINSLQVGNHNIVDKVVSDDGEAAWYLFRIPINQPTKTVGPYTDESNRFIRMYMTGWSEPVVLRMAKMQLVASQWRKSTENLKDKGFDVLPETGSSDFEVSVVNIEENSLPADGKPPYVLPPGITRDLDNTTTISRQVNEQSLKICVEDLEDGDARAVYKEVTQDLVNYGRLKMFFHAEQYQNDLVADDEMTGFIRLGLDRTGNYYEIEVPLKITPDNAQPYSKTDVWPEANEIDIALNELYGVKSARNGSDVNVEDEFSRQSSDGKYKLTIVGNPKLNNVTTMMIGVRNPKSDDNTTPYSLCIWANEMRLTDYDDTKGWAANARMSVKLADFATINAATRYTSVGFGGIQDNISQRSRDETIAYDLSMNMNVDKLIPWNTGIKIPMFVSYSKSKQTPKYDPLDPDIPLDASVLKFDDQKERDEYKDKVISQTVNKSINFIDVHKEKVKEDAKSHIYDIENFSFSYAYSEQKSSNVNTKEDFRKEYDGNVSYQYSPQPPSFEPFKNSDALSSPYLKLIKDINISPLPNNFSARASMNRVFRKRQLRNADLTTIGIDPNFEKYFTFNRTYNLRWSIFKSLSLNYNATANAIIDEPEGEIDTQVERDSIWNNIKSMGRMKSYDQSIAANYRLPLDKLPITDWMSADYRYNVNYRWTGGNIGQVEEYGNLVENSRTKDLTGKFDLVKLYNKSKYLKSINSPSRSRSRSTRSRVPARVDSSRASSGGGGAFKGLARLLMSVRSVNLTLGQRESTSLPGFAPVPYLFGMDSDFDAPGAAFIFGSQDPTIRFTAAENGWLVENGKLTANFVQSLTDDLNIRANVEPFKDLKIQLDAKRSETSTFQELYKYDTSDLVQDFRSYTPIRSGSYTVTFLPIKTAFVKDNGENISPTFEQFVENRDVIRQRLNLLNSNGEYDINSQDVLIPAFIAAYTGQDATSVKLTPFPKTPVPNWRVDYAGLSKIKAFKEIFSSINLTHAYVSTFSITNYSSLATYNNPDLLELSNSITDYPQASQLGDNGTLTPVYVINQVDVIERFSPLIGINIRTKNNITSKIEFKKERSLSLNMSNSQITEQTSNDIAFDFGITKSKMKLPFKIQGRTTTLNNDIQLRMTFTVRNTKTIQRKIEDVQTVTNGDINYQIRPTLNYVANSKLNVTMYFEKNINQPKVSNTFNRSSSAFGIQMQFNLAQ